MQLRTADVPCKKEKMARPTYKGRNGLIWERLRGRENGIARTFESHCATWHKSCKV